MHHATRTCHVLSLVLGFLFLFEGGCSRPVKLLVLRLRTQNLKPLNILSRTVEMVGVGSRLRQTPTIKSPLHSAASRDQAHRCIAAWANGKPPKKGTHKVLATKSNMTSCLHHHPRTSILQFQVWCSCGMRFKSGRVSTSLTIEIYVHGSVCSRQLKVQGFQGLSFCVKTRTLGDRVRILRFKV